MLIIDKLAVEYIHQSNRTGGLLEYIIAVFALTFNNEILTFLYTMLLLNLPYSLKYYLFCVLSPATNLYLTTRLKKWISRPRPELNVPRFEALIFDFRGREKNHSMPSGDSSQCSAFWFTLFFFGFVPLWAALSLIFLTMFARVYYMCHYPTDTILGLLLGALVLFPLNALFALYFR